MVEARCFACGGEGRVACTACDGKGHTGGFLGVGAKVCPICEGDGHEPCTVCAGRGTTRAQPTAEPSRETPVPEAGGPPGGPSAPQAFVEVETKPVQMVDEPRMALGGPRPAPPPKRPAGFRDAKTKPLERTGEQSGPLPAEVEARPSVAAATPSVLGGPGGGAVLGVVLQVGAQDEPGLPTMEEAVRPQELPPEQQGPESTPAESRALRDPAVLPSLVPTIDEEHTESQSMSSLVPTIDQPSAGPTDDDDGPTKATPLPVLAPVGEEDRTEVSRPRSILSVTLEGGRVDGTARGAIDARTDLTDLGDGSPTQPTLAQVPRNDPARWLERARRVEGVAPSRTLPWARPAAPVDAADPADPPRGTSREGLYAQARATYERLVSAGRSSLEWELALLCADEARDLEGSGDTAASLGLYERATSILERLAVSTPLLGQELARTLADRATVLEQQGDFDQATRHYDRAIALFEEKLAGGDASLVGDLARTLTYKALALDRQGDPRSAATAYDRAIDLWKRLVEAGETQLEDDLARAYMNKGVAVEQLGDLGQAVALFENAIAIWGRLIELDGRRDLTGDLAWTMAYRAGHLATLGRAHEARLAAKKAVELLQAEVDRTGRTDLLSVLQWATTELAPLLGPDPA